EAALEVGSGDDWRRLMDRAARMWRALEGPFLSRPLDGPTDLFRQAVRVGDVRTIAPLATLRGLARRHLRDPRLRLVLERYATYSGSDPRRAPAALAVVAYVEQAFGAWYVRGGLHRFGEALRDRAAERGAAVHTGTDVSRVLVEEGRASGVELAEGHRLDADVVVANTDAAHLYTDLLDTPPATAARHRLGRATPSLSGVVLLLGVRGRTEGLAHHNVWFPPDYTAEFEAIFGPAPRPVPDPTIYVSVPRDPTVAPPDHEAWFLLVNAPCEGPVAWDEPGLADRYADHLLGVLASRGTDVRGRIVFRQILTPADLQRRTRAAGGAIYGTASNGPRAAFLRPANRSPVPGLFLVGGSSHPGGGLPLVVLSARIVADLIGPALRSNATRRPERCTSAAPPKFCPHRGRGCARVARREEPS
ncbi:MAG: phytoene desaturase family protein, partial [Egibacteraceae bacterium]